MALSEILPLLSRRREFLFLSDQLESGTHPWLTGPGGAAKAYVLAGLIARLSSKAPAWLVLTPGREQAEKLSDDLAAFLPASAGPLHLLTPWEAYSPEDLPPVEVEGARQRILESLRRGGPQVIVMSIAGALQAVSNPAWVETVRVAVAPRSPMDLGEAARRLVAAGYDRTDL